MARLNPEERLALILGAAVELANRDGLCGFKGRDLVERCARDRIPSARSTVFSHIGSMRELRRRICASPDAAPHVMETGRALGIR